MMKVSTVVYISQKSFILTNTSMFILPMQNNDSSFNKKTLCFRKLNMTLRRRFLVYSTSLFLLQIDLKWILSKTYKNKGKHTGVVLIEMQITLAIMEVILLFYH